MDEHTMIAADLYHSGVVSFDDCYSILDATQSPLQRLPSPRLRAMCRDFDSNGLHLITIEFFHIVDKGQ